MEAFTQEVGGYPFLYADIFMTRDEFEKMFDLTHYEIVREKYHAVGAFPHLYDKVKPEIDVIKVGKDFMDPLWIKNNSNFIFKRVNEKSLNVKIDSNKSSIF